MQRFGSALDLNPRRHMVVADGFYARAYAQPITTGGTCS